MKAACPKAGQRAGRARRAAWSPRWANSANVSAGSGFTATGHPVCTMSRWRWRPSSFSWVRTPQAIGSGNPLDAPNAAARAQQFSCRAGQAKNVGYQPFPADRMYLGLTVARNLQNVRLLAHIGSNAHSARKVRDDRSHASVPVWRPSWSGRDLRGGRCASMTFPVCRNAAGDRNPARVSPYPAP